MDLYCPEKLQDNQTAERDPAVFKDMRVLLNLLAMEKAYVPRCNYFVLVQNDVQPFMRKVVASWMLEVCEEQNCEDQVFPLAMNLVDRFLCECAISRRHLQLLGAVCMLLASKARQCVPLAMDLLCAYTDHSYTRNEMRDWEVLVLTKLRWEATAITGYDIAEHTLARLAGPEERAEEAAEGALPVPFTLHTLTRQHTMILVCFCYVEPEFIQSPPSLIATACICAAIRGLHPCMEPSLLKATEGAVHALTQTNSEATESIIRRVECALAEEVTNYQSQQEEEQRQQQQQQQEMSVTSSQLTASQLAAPLLAFAPVAALAACDAAAAQAQEPLASAKTAGVMGNEVALVEQDGERLPDTPIDVQAVRF